MKAFEKIGNKFRHSLLGTPEGLFLSTFDEERNKVSAPYFRRGIIARCAETVTGTVTVISALDIVRDGFSVPNVLMTAIGSIATGIEHASAEFNLGVATQITAEAETVSLQKEVERLQQSRR